MFNFSIKNNNLGITSLYHSVNDVAFCILIEAIDWNFSQNTDNSGFHNLLMEVLCLLDDNTDIGEVPYKIANNLDSILKKSNRRKNEMKGLNFTGISLTKEKIYVCTAGYCRVHLLKNSKLLEITRDHNLVSDLGSGLSTQNLDVSFEQSPEVYFTHTRTLGFDYPNKPPELVSWVVEGDYTILICSDKYHYFRKPHEYLESFIRGKNLNLVEHDKNPIGVIAKIEYKENN